MNRRRRINLAIPTVFFGMCCSRETSLTKAFKTFLIPKVLENRQSIYKATKFSCYILWWDRHSSLILARYLLSSSTTSLEGDLLPCSLFLMKIARKIPDPIPKFHGFVDLTLVAITRASLNYRGVSLYFGRRREIFLTHQLYRREGKNTSQMAREDGWDTGLRWKFRASRISFSTLCVCLSSSTFAKRPAILS